MLNSIATIIAIAVAGGFCSVWLAVFMFCMKRGLIAVKASLTAGYRASKWYASLRASRGTQRAESALRVRVLIETAVC